MNQQTNRSRLLCAVNCAARTVSSESVVCRWKSNKWVFKTITERCSHSEGRISWVVIGSRIEIDSTVCRQQQVLELTVQCLFLWRKDDTYRVSLAASWLMDCCQMHDSNVCSLASQTMLAVVFPLNILWRHLWPDVRNRGPIMSTNFSWVEIYRYVSMHSRITSTASSNMACWQADLNEYKPVETLNDRPWSFASRDKNINVIFFDGLREGLWNRRLW